MGECNGIDERIIIVGDSHLSSKNRGNHVDYSKESLDAVKYIADYIKKPNKDGIGVTRYIGLGDISYGKFELTYRSEVEKVYEDIYKTVNGNRYELRGNHDISNIGISEWEYYTNNRGLINSTNDVETPIDGDNSYRVIDMNCVRLHLIDYGHENVKLDISENAINIVLCHTYVAFSDTKMPNYGKQIILDDFSNWYGVDIIICGHIHTAYKFNGHIKSKDNTGNPISKPVTVCYTGSVVRTDYSNLESTHGSFYDISFNRTAGIDSISIAEVEIPWMKIEDEFTIEDVIKEKKRIDISDIVKEMDDRERNIGSAEDAINIMEIEQKYKEKAIELLRDA